MNTKNFFVLVSTSIGGAERRFFDIFLDLRSMNKSLYIIMPFSLAKMLNCTEQEGVIVIGVDTDNLAKFILKYTHFLNSATFSGCSFHYPINCLFFLHFFRKHKVSMSLTNCYYTPKLLSKNKSLVRQYISMFFVNHIDVLSPTIYKNLSYTFNKKVSLTPNGTYIKSGIYKNEFNKKNNIGFLGRLVEGKGLEDFIHIYESLWLKYKNQLPQDFCFIIAGYGKNEEIIRHYVNYLSNKNIPIKFLGYKNTDDFLAKCKVILSLQKITNYPSRVVAESLLSGAHVIVRDTGNSRDFGQLNGLHYISEKLDVDEIGNLLSNIFEKYASENYYNKIIEDAKIRFSNKIVLDYFLKIMEK